MSKTTLLLALALALPGCTDTTAPQGGSAAVNPPARMSSNDGFPVPVAWWSAEGDMIDRLGIREGVAETATAVSFAEGRVGQAFHLNGTGGIRVPDEAPLEPQQLTVALWFRRLGSPGLYRYLLAKGINGCSNASYGVYTGANGGLIFYIAPTRGSYALSPTAAIADVWDGEWHHVTGTYDGAVVRIYVDGVQVQNGNPAV